MQHIPNLLTLGNLFCGCCAIVSVLTGNYIDGVWFFCAGFIFDAADGPVARKLGVSSPLGKELDSLADMVSFGILPGMIMYSLLLKSFAFQPDWIKYTHTTGVNWRAMPAFLISMAAGYRLAKFNIDTREGNVFFGLATPACTTFIVGLMLIYHSNAQDLGEKLMNPYLLYSMIPILAFLQISELPLMKFRMKHYRWKENEMRYAFLGLLVIGLLFFQEAVFSASIIFYIVCSLLDNAFFKEKTSK
jgi:CDP-diacylglycerol---serine O-phosphatidyltransferase